MSAEDGSDQVPTRDISYDESICLQRLLQENRDNAFMVEYMLQAKGSKGEWRIVLIGQHRVFTLKPGGKLSKSIHYLDMKRIESPNETTLVLHCEGAGTLPFRTNKATQALNLINKANKTLFPSRPAELGPRFEVTPASRLEAVPVPEAACDSLAVTYETWCNYLGLAVREDIIWDINNLLAGNVKDFNFGEFENVRDYRPLLFSLAHNQWFRAFRIKSFPVESKTWPHIVGLFALTTAIDELILRSIGVSKDSFGSLFEAITQNDNNIIQVIDVSNNQLDDNSVKALAQLVERMDHGLIELRMRECQGRKKAMKVLAGAFRKNAHFAQTLSVLEMDGSELAADGSTAIASFLSQPNALVRLSLSNTSLKIEPVGAALQRGSQNLRTLNLADNRVTQGDINALALFIQGSENLASLNLDGTQFPVRGLENIIQAIANNYVLGNFSLSLARNGLGAEGAAVLGGLIPDARNIIGLDLSGNSFEDDGVQTLVTGLQSSLTLKRLNLSSNMKKRTATRERAMDAICELIESECPLESLTIRGSGKLVLRDDTLALLDAVGFNKTLTHLDISGNGMGDSGAFSLGKALQLNSTLRSLSIDNNGITLRGFIAFTIGLARNRSLVKMPLPLFDITNAAKGNLDKTQRLTDEMSSYLARNQNPASFTGEDEDGVRRTANVAVSHADEYQKMVLRIRAMCSDEELAGEINTLLEDAEREESVSSRMNLLVEEYHARTQDEVRIRMRAFVEEIGAWVSEQAGEMSGRMLELCGDFQSLADAMPRLERSIEYGSNTFDEDKLKALLDDVHGEMCRISQKPFTSIAQISSSFSYERLSDALDETFQDLRDAKAAAEVAAAEAAREEEEAAAAAAAAPKAGPKPKTKPKPKKKPSKGKGKAKGKAKDRGGASTSSAAGAGAADVAQVEATTPLVSATKSRPKRRGNRRPPTRRPRNRDA